MACCATSLSSLALSSATGPGSGPFSQSSDIFFSEKYLAPPTRRPHLT